MKALVAMLHDNVDPTMPFVKIANVCVIQAASFIMVMIVWIVSGINGKENFTL